MRTVRLERPPLERVLTQVRYPRSFRVETEDFGAALDRALADSPYRVAATTHEPALDPADPMAPPKFVPIWRFRSTDDVWQFSVGASFASLETTRYEGHRDFMSRLTTVLHACAKVVQPARADRIGIRYTMRLTDPTDLDDLPDLFRPEIVGTAANHDVEQHSLALLAQGEFVTDAGRILTRWGLLPPSATIDPSLPTHDVRSWVLDVDAFDSEQHDFHPEQITERALTHSRHAYRLFRWAVEPELLRRFGANEDDLVDALREEGLFS